MPTKPSSHQDRYCPALNQGISSQRCGSERGTLLSCPASCPHFPYATDNYDKALLITQKVVAKILSFIKTEVDQSEMKRLLVQAGLNTEKSRANPDQFYQHMINFGLTFYRNPAGETLLDIWRRKGFNGLTNDEQVAVMGYGRSFVSVLEVQDVAASGELWVVDVLNPEAGRFLIIDRNAAKSTTRFSLIYAWFLPLPHYTRISGVIMVSVSRDTFGTWKADLDVSHRAACLERPSLTREEYLASTFEQQIERMTEIGKEWQTSMLKGMDLCRAISRFTFSAPSDDLIAVLSTKRDLERTAPTAGDGFDMPLRQFIWLRRGESKALEEEMPAAFRHRDDDESVGGLATVRVYADRLVLEAFSRQKYDFARGLLNQWFGSQLTLQAESIEDMAQIMANRGISDDPEPSPSSSASPYALFASGSKTKEAREVAMSTPLPSEVNQQLLQAFYDQKYRKFLDERVPMIGNATPREASRRKELRPQLIELMKLHIQGIEETNRSQGTNISLDGLLEELGLRELRSQTKPR